MHAVDTVDDRIARIIGTKRRLMDEAIGLEDIRDTPEDTVKQIIQTWSETCQVPLRGDITQLGLGKPLPPLPKKGDVAQIFFAGERWNKSSVRAWAEMNGYKAIKIHFDSRFWRLRINTQKTFVPQSFRTYSVSTEIKIIVGVRAKRKSGPKGPRRRR